VLYISKLRKREQLRKRINRNYSDDRERNKTSKGFKNKYHPAKIDGKEIDLSEISGERFIA
jgi:hypothetical protein